MTTVFRRNCLRIPVAVYRSEAGRHAIEECYDDAVAALPVDVTERTVETRHGDTHVLLAGDAAAPPVFVFHGGNATNPMTLSWYAALADEYRLIAPDTVGQPGKSAETDLDPRGEDYGEWVLDLLDAFDVETAPTIGTSYGAGIVLRTAALAPERVGRAALVVPAGFGTGSLSGMAGVGTAALTYRFYPSERVLDRTLAALVTDPAADPICRETVAACIRHAHLTNQFPRADASELAGFDAPVALFVAAEDPFFPPDPIVERARERLPTLDLVEVLEGEKHILSAAARERVTASIRRFLAAA